MTYILIKSLKVYNMPQYPICDSFAKNVYIKFNYEDMGLSELRELVMDREACRAVVHGVTKSRTRLRD